jgi:cellobiose phosphorylase
MYQAAIHELLGLRRRGDTISITPCVPAMWPDYSIELRHGRTRYRIQVTNLAHQHGGIAQATLDGQAIAADRIPFVDDGGTHEVSVVIGVHPSAR